MVLVCKSFISAMIWSFDGLKGNFGVKNILRRFAQWVLGNIPGMYDSEKSRNVG